jgi:serine/threonine protein kinase
MLSPLASCNLKIYWKNNRPRLHDSNFVLWELRQLRGLADGLRYIYNLGGWHHDLKGENLLVFEEGDSGGPTLKIADFGSAKIHARRSGPRDESSPTNSYCQGTSAYEAPDYVIRGETSRPYDVWTLGCIFMDMLVWTFGSTTSELETFSNERRRIRGDRLGTDTMFWYVEFDGRHFTTHWKPHVRKRLQGLEDLCNSDKGRAVFKELVLTTSKMLRMDPSARPKPYEVHNDMDRMTLWAEEAVKEPDWSIQNFLIGAIPSTTKSETSGASDGDGAPVRAEFGHLMMNKTMIREPTLLAGRRAPRRSLRDGNDLNFMGLNPNLQFSEIGSNAFQLVVDDVDYTLDGTTPRLDNSDGRLLLGSHWISPDRDAFAEARTAVQSAAASESHLAPSPQVSMASKTSEGHVIGTYGDSGRRYSVS